MSYRLLLTTAAAGAIAALSPAHAHDHVHHHGHMHHAHHHEHAQASAHHHTGHTHFHWPDALPHISLTLGGAYKSDTLALNQREEGFALGHTELSIYDTIGDLFFGKATVVAHSHDDDIEFELEEAFIETRALPAGFQLRAGRFLSQIGYLNEQHVHEDSFAERPLLYRAFLGNHYFDDGVRLNWHVPTAIDWTIGVEVFSGEQLMPGADASARDDIGVITYSTTLRGRVGANHRWQIGLSYLDNRLADAGHAHHHHHHHGAHHHHAHGARFSGEDLYMVNLTWLWAPTGQPHQQQLRLTAEYARVENVADFGTSDDIHQAWYAAAVYRFHPDWSAGVRYGELEVSQPHVGPNFPPHFHYGQLSETAVMVAWRPSHRSTIRLQYSHQSADKGIFEGKAGDAVMLQYVMTFGDHHHTHGF